MSESRGLSIYDLGLLDFGKNRLAVSTTTHYCVAELLHRILSDNIQTVGTHIRPNSS